MVIAMGRKMRGWACKHDGSGRLRRRVFMPQFCRFPAGSAGRQRALRSLPGCMRRGISSSVGGGLRSPGGRGGAGGGGVSPPGVWGGVFLVWGGWGRGGGGRGGGGEGENPPAEDG